MITRFGLFALLYCWLLGPRFVFADVMWLTVFGVALVSPLVASHRTVSAWPMNLLWLAASVLAFYGASIAAVTGTMDFGYTLSWFKAGVFAYSAATLALLYRRFLGKFALQELTRDVVLAAAMSAVIALLLFVMADLRERVNGMIVGTIANTFFGQIGLRAYDLSIGGGTAYGIFNLIVMVLLYHHKTLFGPAIRIALFVLLAVVNFLSARSAFGATLALFLLSWAFNLAPGRWFPVVARAAGLLAVVIGPGLLALWAGLLPSLDDSDKLNNFVDNTLPWAFELFINADKGDGVTSTTTQQIRNEFFFPNTLEAFLFGAGDSDPMSDSGLVRTIFAVGFFGLAVHLSLVAGFWRVGMLHIKGSAERRVLSITAMLLLLFNFKEIIFSNSRGLFGIFSLLFFAFLILRPARAGSVNENQRLHCHLQRPRLRRRTTAQHPQPTWPQ
jgi:hypothetical protein